ncbi:MAG: hypothetical protein LQ342_004414 [Letrouitia transgressa]|nr:MAG: hypothetical protein LQ342_004414 [Letrouitia transgressa]
MATQTTPEGIFVTWAQRSSASNAEKNLIYLTIAAPDVPKIDLDLKSTSLKFTGTSETKKTTYHVELEFWAEIDVENSKTHHTSRDVFFVLRKKESKEEYWPRLLKEDKKVHFLKTDFDKWVDEDEQEGGIDDDLSAMGGGMPGMDPDGGFGNIDFSKLGAGAGAGADLGGFGGEGADLGGLGGEGADDDEDDDDMPGLEEDEDAKGKAPESEGASKPKIEEVP